MKTRVLLSFVVLTFLITAFSGLVSAAVFETHEISQPTSILNNAGSFNVVFNMTYTGTSSSITVDLSNSVITKGSASISFSPGPANITLNQNETKIVTATVTFTSGQSGTINGTITADPSSGSTTSFDFLVTLTQSSTNTDDFETSGDFCAYSKGVTDNHGSLSISVRNPDVVNGYGSSGKWYPFDDVEFEIKVENNGNADVNDISLEWGIYDQDAQDWIKEVDEEDNFDLNEGDDDTYTISLTVDESDLDVDLADLDNGHTYTIYARINGEIADGNFKGNETCDYAQRDVDIVIESNFVTLTNFKIPDSVSCGDTMTISADAWNIGRRDQDKVTVGVSVKDLGNFKQIFNVGDINSFDKETIDFQIPIPQNTTTKTYTATFDVYDEDSQIFENKNNEKATYPVLFKVGSCGTPSETGDTVVVSADLASGGKAGQPLSINAVITNTGDKQITLALNAAGYAQWANSVNMDKNSLTLAPGQSGDVKLVFDVKSSASGDQLFNLEATSGNQLVANQPVSIFITGAKTGLSGLFGDNWYLWVLGLVNLVLVVLIIVVAVRVARKK